MPQPMHISESLRLGLAKIVTKDSDGKRLPTAYIMSRLNPNFFQDQLEEFARRDVPADVDKAVTEWLTTASDVDKAKWQPAQAERFAR